MSFATRQVFADQSQGFNDLATHLEGLRPNLDQLFNLHFAPDVAGDSLKPLHCAKDFFSLVAQKPLLVILFANGIHLIFEHPMDKAVHLRHRQEPPSKSERRDHAILVRAKFAAKVVEQRGVQTLAVCILKERVELHAERALVVVRRLQRQHRCLQICIVALAELKARVEHKRVFFTFHLFRELLQWRGELPEHVLQIQRGLFVVSFCLRQ